MTPINHYEGERPDVITQHNYSVGLTDFHGWQINPSEWCLEGMDVVAIFRIKYKTI